MKINLEAEASLAVKALRAAMDVPRRIDVVLARGATQIHRDAVRNAPNVEGTLRSNIRPGRIGFLIHQVESSARTAQWVEEGTGLLGAGARPMPRVNQMISGAGVAAIALWIQRRGITPRGKVTPQQLPWLIARKIALYGTRPQPYLMPAAEKNEPRIQQRIVEAVRDGLIAAGFEVTP